MNRRFTALVQDHGADAGVSCQRLLRKLSVTFESEANRFGVSRFSCESHMSQRSVEQIHDVSLVLFSQSVEHVLKCPRSVAGLDLQEWSSRFLLFRRSVEERESGRHLAFSVVSACEDGCAVFRAC